MRFSELGISYVELLGLSDLTILETASSFLLFLVSVASAAIVFATCFRKAGEIKYAKITV